MHDEIRTIQLIQDHCREVGLTDLEMRRLIVQSLPRRVEPVSRLSDAFALAEMFKWETTSQVVSFEKDVIVEAYKNDSLYVQYIHPSKKNMENESFWDHLGTTNVVVSTTQSLLPCFCTCKGDEIDIVWTVNDFRGIGLGHSFANYFGKQEQVRGIKFWDVCV